MQTTANDIITRALGVADFVNSSSISYNDKLNSLNEAYKDIYTLALDSDDDYFLTEVVVPITSAMINPSSVGQYPEYRVPLPADVDRIRYIDYQGGSNWYPMNKYPISMKDYNPSIPMYRWENQNLYVLGGGLGYALTTIRIGYYPAPKTISLPAPTVNLGSTLPIASQIAIVSPAFTGVYVGANINQGNGSLGKYVYYNGTAIVSEDEDLGTVTTLLTIAGVTMVTYYQNYVYYLIPGTGVSRFLTDLNSLGTPSLVYGSATANQFNILQPNQSNSPGQNGVLIWVGTATNGYVVTLTGSVVYTLATPYVSFFNCQNLWWACDGTNVYQFAGITFLPANASVTLAPGYSVSQADSDGTNIFVEQTGTQNLRKWFLTTTPYAAGVPTTAQFNTIGTDTVVASNANFAPTWTNDNGMLCYTGVGGTSFGVSTQENTSFTYPNNFVPELISYQAAIDFLAKQHADTSAVEKRYAALYKRYIDSLKRDDYQVERIKNDNPQTNSYYR